MATFLRGMPDLIDSLKQERTKLQNRLANDDARRVRGERTGRMTKEQRAGTQGEIQGLNVAILYIEGSIILSESEFDRRFTLKGLKGL